tara:strand:- start:5172 stop:6569 length:1398 start_codon:yes stop_codon:yes gene_type:complete
MKKPAKQTTKRTTKQTNAKEVLSSPPLGPDILVHGGGNSAKITALCLSAAGFRAALHDAPAPALPDWQSVLALSPAARVMLETLGVWQKLDQPCAPITDMHVYASASDISPAASGSNTGSQKSEALFPASLGFGAPQDGNNHDDVEVLAHIVSLASLGRAMSAALDMQILEGRIERLASPIVDFSAKENRATLADGTQVPSQLLIDTQKAPTPWRQKAAARPLRHDYAAAALVGTLRRDRAHGGMAQQIFLPSGPLALLPLPVTKTEPASCASFAMVWSLPKARAEALAKVEPAVVAYELNKATQGRFGALSVDGPLAVQDLHLQLAENFIDGSVVLLGEAAHVIHPLAGQGFNLTLRDASLLADVLFETRQLGLALGDGAMLATYETARRADAKLTAATTHGLANLFGGPMAKIARLGMAVTRQGLQKNTGLREQMNAQANSGLSVTPQGRPLARLMRGELFRD